MLLFLIFREQFGKNGKKMFPKEDYLMDSLMVLLLKCNYQINDRDIDKRPPTETFGWNQKDKKGK